MTTVSLIIPIYNVADCVERSLISALEQTYPQIQYVVVDDCGQDDSMSIVRSIIMRYPQKECIFIKHEHNKGLSEARNTGLVHATGDFVLFMDSDDIIDKNCVDRHVSALEVSNAQFSDANVNVIGASSRFFFPYKKTELVKGSDELLKSYFNNKIHLSAWNKMIRREWLIDNKLFFEPGLIYEDAIWTMKLCAKADSMVKIDYHTYDYIIRNNSITSNANNMAKQYDSILTIFKMSESIVKDRNKSVIKCYCRWLTKNRFTFSARLVSLYANIGSAEEYYRKLNSVFFSNYSVGLYSILLRMPYSCFRFFFCSMYKFYKKISSI